MTEIEKVLRRLLVKLRVSLNLDDTEYGLSRQEKRRLAAEIDAALAQQDESECRCTMRERMVGDGCSVCNPELAAELEGDEPPPAQDEREEFEAWMREEYAADEDMLKKPHEGHYFYAKPANMWSAWQARAARPAQDERECVTGGTVSELLAAIMHFGSEKWAEGRGAADPELANVRAAWDSVYSLVQDLATRPAQTEQQPWDDSMVRDFLSVALRHVEVKGTLHSQDIRDALRYMAERYAAPIAQTAPQGTTSDTLIKSAKALLALDEKGSLAPHGIGGLAREVIEKLIARVEQTAPQPEQSGLGALAAAIAEYDALPKRSGHAPATRAESDAVGKVFRAARAALSAKRGETK